MTTSMLKRVTMKPLVAAVVLIFAACSTTDILDVEDPDIINPAAVNSRAGAVALYTGAIGEFSVAIVGDNGGLEGQILVTGSFTDELINSETFPTRLEYELRQIDPRNGTLATVFRQLHRARVLLEATVPALQKYAPTPPYQIGEAYALAGFTYVFAGENYCSGVPFSQAFPEVVYGVPLTTAEIFTVAIERFDSAMTYLQPPVDTTALARQLLNLARVGKGRALLNRGGSGDYAAAAAAVAAVPLNFVYTTTHSTASDRQRNGIFAFTWQNKRFSVADAEGTNGLNFRAALDPRVVVDRTPSTNVGFDAFTPQWNPVKYPTTISPTPIANGVEAQLIIAENQLALGDSAGWLNTLNLIRASAGVPGLAPLVDPPTVAAQQDLMFRERAFWMFLTGHRLGDLRRLMRQYGRQEAFVFPTGLGLKGFYGNDLNLPVPFDELNNPNFTGCLDRNP